MYGIYGGKDMIEKRFKVTDCRDNPFLCDWSVTDYADGGIVSHPMTSENMANVMCDLLNELHEEKEELKKENQMLKHTIGRNETYIARLTHKGEWKDTSRLL